MKLILFTKLLILLLIFNSCSDESSPVIPKDDNILSIDDYLKELNLMRSNPSAYADLIEATLRYYNGNLYSQPGRTPIQTNEGRVAAEEAINALRATPNRQIFILSQELSNAAQDHANDQSKTGQLGHVGSNGSTFVERIEKYTNWRGIIAENIMYGPHSPREILFGLLIDDGVPDRGHRVTLLNPRYTNIGIGIATHPVYRYVCVHKYAESLTPKGIAYSENKFPN